MAAGSWLLFQSVNMQYMVMIGSILTGCGDSGKLSGDSSADSDSRKSGVGMRGGFAENAEDFHEQEKQIVISR